MPAYLFWGEDRFLLLQAVQQLRQKVVDTQWQAFNDQRFNHEQTMTALNESVTLPFGTGGKLITIDSSRLFQAKDKADADGESEENLTSTATTKGKRKGDKTDANPLLTELERTLNQIPETNHLLFLTASKPNGTLKQTKLLQKYADIREFALIPSYREEDLIRRVQALAREKNVALTPAAVQYLVEALGNDTGRLHNEIEKLALYPSTKPLDLAEVQPLVISSAHNVFQLTDALAQGDAKQALSLLAQLTQQNEHPLKICAGLVYQFRLWLWVKLLLDQGANEAQIADETKIAPKRVFIVKKQVQSLSSPALLKALPLLLRLEEGLKTGQPSDYLFTQIILELSSHFLKTAPNR